MTRRAHIKRGRGATIGIIVGLALGVGACAQIIGVEPWEGSSSSMAGGGGASGATSTNTSGAGGRGAASASSSSSSSSAANSSASSSMASSSASSSGGNAMLCQPCQSSNECKSGCCQNICVLKVNGCLNNDPCSDGCKDGLETDVDCGGQNTCPRCVAGKRCNVSEDCESGICTPNAGGNICG